MLNLDDFRVMFVDIFTVPFWAMNKNFLSAIRIFRVPIHGVYLENNLWHLVIWSNALESIIQGQLGFKIYNRGRKIITFLSNRVIWSCRCCRDTWPGYLGLSEKCLQLLHLLFAKTRSYWLFFFGRDLESTIFTLLPWLLIWWLSCNFWRFSLVWPTPWQWSHHGPSFLLFPHWSP